MHTAVLLAKDKERAEEVKRTTSVSKLAMSSWSAMAWTIKGNTGTSLTSACSSSQLHLDPRW